MLNNILVGLSVFLLCACGAPGDDSDLPDGRRSGMRPLTDALTGCQYLADGHGLVPRMNGDGRHVGCK